MSLSKVRFGGALAALMLVVVQAAYAAEKQPLKFNPADQAAAKAITLKLPDLGAGWKGGPAKLTSRRHLPDEGVRSRHDWGRQVDVQRRRRLRHLGSEHPPHGRNGQDRLAAHRRKPSLLGLRPARDGKPRGRSSFAREDGVPEAREYSARYRLVYDFGKAGSPTLVLMDLIMVGRGEARSR